LKQLTIDHPPGTLLSGPWKREELAEQSADVYRRRGVEVEVVKRDGRYCVEAP